MDLQTSPKYKDIAKKEIESVLPIGIIYLVDKSK